MTLTETNHTTVATVKTEIDNVDDAGKTLVEQTRSAAGQVRATVGDAVSHVPDALASAKTGVDQVAEHIPAAVENTRVVAQRTTTSLQALPDTTLRLIAGASIGLAAGLSLGRVPRLLAVAALVPAMFVGSALATRSTTDRHTD